MDVSANTNLETNEDTSEDRLLANGHEEGALQLQKRPDSNVETGPKMDGGNASEDSGKALTLDPLQRERNSDTESQEIANLEPGHLADNTEKALNPPDPDFEGIPKLDAETAPSDSEKSLNLPLDPLDPSAYPEGGRSAWLVVFSSFSVQFIIIGIRDSFGVLQRYWVYNATFPNTSNVSVAFVGAVGASGFAVFGPPAGRLADRFGYQRVTALGGLLVAIGFNLGSFGSELWQMYLSLSVFFMVGLPLAYYPAVSAPQTYFLRRRSLAFGISVAGSGLGGFAITNLEQYLLDTVGWRNTLRILGTAGGVGIMLVAVLLKPRLVTTKKGALYQFHFFRDRKFLKLFAIQATAALGFYIPSFYLPSFGTNIGVPPATSSFILSIQSIFSFLGRLIIPLVGTFTGQFNIFLVTLALQGISVIAILAPAQTAAQMYAFAIVYGFCGAGYTSTGTLVIADVLGTADLSTKLGHVFLAILPGQLAGPSIAGALIDKTTVILPDGTRQSNFWGAWIFCGVMMFPIAWFFVAWLRMEMAKWKVRAKV